MKWIFTELFETPTNEGTRSFRIGKVPWSDKAAGVVLSIEWLSFGEHENDGLWEVTCEHATYSFPALAVAVKRIPDTTLPPAPTTTERTP